jgi:hypothetical protein
MESILTIGPGHFHAVDLALRATAVLVAGTALLLGLAGPCFGAPKRLVLAIASAGLACAAWFEWSVSSSWRGAFELAGTSYCVTGLPLASEERVLAWSLGVPVLLFCYGLAWLGRGTKAFRNLAVATLLAAVLGAFFMTASVVALLYVMKELRGTWLGSAGTSPSVIAANRIGLGAMWGAILLVILGRLNLLPFGSGAENILAGRECVRALCDVLALVVPALALLASLAEDSAKEGRRR